MICIQERYLRYNRIALLTIGLWPYQRQSSNLVRLQLVLFLGILISYITFQFSRLLFRTASLEFIIKMLSVITFFIFFLTKYISFVLNMKTMRYLIERLQYVHNRLQDKNEIAIYDKYGIIAKRCTIVIILAGISAIFILIGVQCCPYIFDIIMSKNETHIRYLIIILRKYYVTEGNYFDIFTIYCILILHMNVTIIMGTFTLVATGAMMLSYFIFICAMFKIASYRLERAMTNTSQSITSKNGKMIYKELICSVDIHRKAMEFAKYFICNFEGSVFILVVMTVFCLSLNIFRIFQITLHADETDELLILHIVVTMVILSYMFIGNYVGQKITDYNNDIFFTAYNIQWYTASLNVQKVILFLLQRGSRIFTLKVGGLFTASLECFASITSASISYFSVMYSKQ
ncbi:Or9e49 [Eciton burchellii]|nr:Or9e49 [Eciton burchellii]